MDRISPNNEYKETELNKFYEMEKNKYDDIDNFISNPNGKKQKNEI